MTRMAFSRAPLAASTPKSGNAPRQIKLEVEEEIWSLEKLIDELSYELMCCRGYYDQARSLVYLIPVTNPPRPFKIRLSELSERSRGELHRCTKRGLTYVLKESVGRVFENVDHRYFHQSVKRKLVVELVD